MTFYGSAPYSFSQGVARMNSYGFSGTPSVMIDGDFSHVGGASSGSMYTTYLPSFLSREAPPSPLVMDANYVILGNEITMTVSVAVDLAVTPAITSKPTW